MNASVCSLKECLIVVGILLGYLFSYIFIDTTGGWRYIFGLAAIPTVVLAAGMVSPRCTVTSSTLQRQELCTQSL